MTRFMITLEQGVELVWHAAQDMVGGEIYVKNTLYEGDRYRISNRSKCTSKNYRH